MSTSSWRSYLDKVTRKHSVKRVVFCLRSGSDSADVDIYCLIEGRSFVDASKSASGRWVEVFADNRHTLRWKFTESDEIVLSFFRDLRFAFGNRGEYDAFRREALQRASRYTLPEARLRKLQYRLVTLGSKLYGRRAVKDRASRAFLLGAIAYPLVQAALSANHICPRSPKTWLVQAKEALPAQEYKLLLKVLRQGDLRALEELVQLYAAGFESLSIERPVSTLTAIV
jgi:hypothetical protein